MSWGFDFTGEIEDFFCGRFWKDEARSKGRRADHRLSPEGAFHDSPGLRFSGDVIELRQLQSPWAIRPSGHAEVQGLRFLPISRVGPLLVHQVPS